MSSHTKIKQPSTCITVSSTNWTKATDTHDKTGGRSHHVWQHKTNEHGFFTSFGQHLCLITLPSKNIFYKYNSIILVNINQYFTKLNTKGDCCWTVTVGEKPKIPILERDIYHFIVESALKYVSY